MRYSQFALFASISLLCTLVYGCSHQHEHNISPGTSDLSLLTNEQTFRDSPFYKELADKPRGYKAQTRAFLERIKKNHQPMELQQWATQVLNNYSDGKEPIQLPRKDIPDFVLKLDPLSEPSFVEVRPHSHVSVVWGVDLAGGACLLPNVNFPPPIILLCIRFNGLRG
jgi:hypothetical protein